MLKNSRYDICLDNISKLFPQNQNKLMQLETYTLIPYMLLAKYVKTLKSIYLLDMNGFNESCDILIRTLYEIVVIIMYCNINPNKNYKRYIEYSIVKRKKLLDCLDESLYCKINDIDNLVKKYREYIVKYEIKENDFKKINNWNGITFKKTVDEVYKYYKCKDVYDFYNNIYTVSSDIVHSGSNDLIHQYFKIVNGKFVFDANPRKDLNNNQLIDKVEVLNDVMIANFRKFL